MKQKVGNKRDEVREFNFGIKEQEEDEGNFVCGHRLSFLGPSLHQKRRESSELAQCSR